MATEEPFSQASRGGITLIGDEETPVVLLDGIPGRRGDQIRATGGPVTVMFAEPTGRAAVRLRVKKTGDSEDPWEYPPLDAAEVAATGTTVVDALEGTFVFPFDGQVSLMVSVARAPGQVGEVTACGTPRGPASLAAYDEK